MNRAKLAIGILLMLSSIFSFGNTYPDAELTQEEGFVDITFRVLKHVKQSDGALRIYVRGKLQERKVGFAIDILPAWKKSAIENTDQFFYWGDARFIRTGEETDEFISALSHLYGLKVVSRKAKVNVPAQVVGLANDPALILSEPTKMKFFFNPDGEENLYSEVFINVDLRSSILQFNEKDMEYRMPLVSSLSE